MNRIPKKPTDVIVNGVRLDSCDTIKVNGTFAERVYCNGILVYQRECNYPPGPFTYTCSAGNCEFYSHTFSSSDGLPAPQYDLYTSSGGLVASNISSGHTTGCSGGSATFYVRARNSEGSHDSNTSSCTCIPCAPDELLWTGSSNTSMLCQWCGTLGFTHYNSDWNTSGNLHRIVGMLSAGGDPYCEPQPIHYGGWIDSPPTGLGNGNSCAQGVKCITTSNGHCSFTGSEYTSGSGNCYYVDPTTRFTGSYTSPSASGTAANHYDTSGGNIRIRMHQSACTDRTSTGAWITLM